jgi:hypothetical protein
MNTFKRKALASAVLGTLGVAGSAHAIYQDPTNLGEALIYPYYTVNNDSAGNPFNTFISVVNTTTQVKVVKVRFREGKNSAEVLDFNLYLSPNDVWTGAVIPASTDTTSPAHLITADVSCTNPGPIGLTGVDFRNYQYVGGAADLLAATLDRTREGYAEMFEMGVLTGALATAATHGASGTPTCTGLTGPVLVGTVGAAMTPPTGGLMGTGTLINVTSGRDTMYNANAFGAWVVGATAYSDIGNDAPNFSNTLPAQSIVVSNPNTTTVVPNVYISTWADSLTPGLGLAGSKAASATMMHADVLNEYILDAATKSDTDWVLTFPTKRLFVNTATAVAPFTAPLTASGACELIDLTFFNREEASAAAAGANFSPLPPGAAANSLCWESTILSFRNGSTNAPGSPAVPSLVLGSANVTTVGVTNTFQNGWAEVHFTGAGASTVGLVSVGGAGTGTSTISLATGAAVTTAQTFHGLPVVGFMIRTFNNGTLTCGTATCQGNYGGSASHGFRNFIVP